MRTQWNRLPSVFAKTSVHLVVSFFCLLGTAPLFGAPKWGDRLSEAAAEDMLRAVIAQGKVTYPFEAFKSGEPTFKGQTPYWSSNLLLLGADKCEIQEFRGTVQGLSHAPFLSLICYAQYSGDAHAMRGYRALVALVGKATRLKVNETTKNVTGGSTRFDALDRVSTTVQLSGSQVTVFFTNPSPARGSQVEVPAKPNAVPSPPVSTLR